VTDGSEPGSGSGLALVLKILLATGLTGLIAGAFLFIFVNGMRLAGLVIILAGISDLVAIYVLQRANRVTR